MSEAINSPYNVYLKAFIGATYANPDDELELTVAAALGIRDSRVHAEVRTHVDLGNAISVCLADGCVPHAAKCEFVRILYIIGPLTPSQVVDLCASDPALVQALRSDGVSMPTDAEKQHMYRHTVGVYMASLVGQEFPVYGKTLTVTVSATPNGPRYGVSSSVVKP